MALQSVNTGSADNDGTGDTVRAAFEKINENFSSLPFVIGFFAGSTFDGGEILFVHTIKEDSTFTFSESDMSFTLQTPCLANCSFSILVEDVEVGTVDFTAGGTVGVAVITGDAFVAALDDVIKLISPDPADDDAAGLAVTMLGYRTLV